MADETPSRAAADKTLPRAGDRIRQTARELFYSQGIRAVGVDEIVTRAGVTKPSLYRNYASKDELAAAYVADFGVSALGRFEATLAKHPGDPREGLLAWFKRLSERAGKKDYRGCGASNAAIEFPERGHPARAAAITHKMAMRLRIRDLCRQMKARKPDQLADGLMLLMEGCLVSGQMFDTDGPAEVAKKAAAALIDAYVDAPSAYAVDLR
jgi:AcrR family transcriptional regulator